MQGAQQLASAAAEALEGQNYTKAEELYRRVIDLVDSSADPKSPSELDVAGCFNALAGLLDKQDKHEEAEKVRARAREITMKELNQLDGFDR